MPSARVPARHEVADDDLAILSWRGAGIMLGAGIGGFLGTGVILLYTIGVFVGPVAASTGWDRSHVASAALPAALIIGLASPFVGALTDRFGPRRVLLVSVVLQSLSVMLIGIGGTTATNFVLMFMFAALLGAAQTPVPMSHMLVGWFRRQRGLAIGVALTFGGLGVAVIPAVAAQLIELFGWRQAYLLLGIGAFLIGLPGTFLLVRDPPLARSVTHDEVAPGLTLRETSRNASFWLILVAFLLIAITATAGAISLPGILTDRGVPPSQAALIMTVVGAALIIGRLGFGLLLDRVRPVTLTAAVFAAPLLGHLLLYVSDANGAAILAALCFGIAAGAEGDALSYLMSRLFGFRHYGRIYGLAFFGYAFGTGLGPALMTFLRERMAEPETAFLIMAAVSGVGSLLMFTQRRLRLPFGTA